MLKGVINKRILSDDGAIWGYIVLDLITKKEFKICSSDLIFNIENGTIEIKDVMVTKNKRLRGKNWFHLSRVDTIKLTDGTLINNIQKSLQYVLGQMIGDNIDKRTNMGIAYSEEEIIMVVKTFIEDYETMTVEMVAEDLGSSIDFYNNNKPNIVENSIDRLEGVVLGSGWIEIKAIKTIKKL